MDANEDGMVRDRSRTRTAIVAGGGIAGPVAAIALRRAGIDAVVYEARAEAMDQAGGWLSLAPNGINALKTLGIDGVITEAAIPTTSLIFANATGKRLGVLDRSAEERRFDAGPIIIKRGHLHRALRDEAIRQGIAVQFGKRLTEIDAPTTGGVTARFADGTSATADLLLGCDGVHSQARRFVLPDGPPPAYTGVVGFSGFARPRPPVPYTAAMAMTFGRHAFVGTFATPSGELFWYDNIPRPQEPAPNELDPNADDCLRQRLIALHRDDPPPIPDLLQATTGEIGTWVIYDIPPLPIWHRGPVCLVGDAAHATSPHGAQGASLALEDPVVVAKCLRDRQTVDDAFAAYQELRKARVERQTRQARRRGGQNLVANPLALWLRDRLMPFFLQRGATADDWLYAYRVDWNDPIAA